MKKSESEFLTLLEEKASEQKKLAESQILPKWASKLGDWLVINPWRVMFPVSVILYLFMRIVGGELVREIILRIYGGYGGV